MRKLALKIWKNNFILKEEEDVMSISAILIAILLIVLSHFLYFKVNKACGLLTVGFFSIFLSLIWFLSNITLIAEIMTIHCMHAIAFLIAWLLAEIHDENSRVTMFWIEYIALLGLIICFTILVTF